MAVLDAGDAQIYHEVHGQGPPLLLLNGIMMSTASWAAFIPELARRFQLILFDFRDQGQSSKMRASFNQDIHVGDIVRLLDHLEISKAHVMGLSYGGQVALRLALQHPAKVRSLSLFNTPSRVPRRLMEIGKAWEAAAALNDPAKFFQLALPFIYSEPFYETHSEFLRERLRTLGSAATREWFESFIRLSRSVEDFAVSPEELKQISVPTLLVGSEQDAVISQEAMRDIYENVPGCEFLMIPRAGHAAFLEKINEFRTLVIGFALKHS